MGKVEIYSPEIKLCIKFIKEGNEGNDWQNFMEELLEVLDMYGIDTDIDTLNSSGFLHVFRPGHEVEELVKDIEEIADNNKISLNISI